MRLGAWLHSGAALGAMALFVSTAAAQGTPRLPNIGTAPVPMQMIQPPGEGTPSSLRGQSVRLVFSVDSVGKVSSVVAIPTITDSVFAKRLFETMRGYRFKPAKDSAGKPVGGEHRVDVTFKN